MLLYWRILSSSDYDGNILGGGSLDLAALGELARPPRLFAGSKRSFWNDPFVSQHLLEAHLDPTNNDASRMPAERDAAIARILGFAAANGASPPGSILDIACGPGLYAVEFARAGYEVLGIDFSPVALAHARRLAEEESVPARFELSDLRSAELGEDNTLAAIIYGAFCTFSNSDRSKLLRRIHRALRPGGVLVLDAFTVEYARRNRSGNDWYVAGRHGFWNDRDHMVLELTHHYPHASTSLARYIVVDSSGRFRLYDVWWRHFTREELVAIIETAGFRVLEVLGSLSGDPYRPGGEWLAAFCIKK